MKKCKKCQQIKELDHFSKNRRICKPCLNEQKRLDYAKNPEKYKLRNARNRKRNHKRVLEQKAAYRIKYSAEIKASKAIYRQNNRKKIAEQDKIHRQNNVGKRNAYSMKHHADKMKRVPKWLTKSDWIEINWAYEYARHLTQEMGIDHVVDHVIPLRGKNISGLHCPQNLQILTRNQNAKKGNKWPYEVK